MINRELIRLKVVQLVYAYYQNEGKTVATAEKELEFSMQKAYDLYLNLLTLLCDLRNVAESKDAVRLAREKRTGAAEGEQSPNSRFAENRFLLQLNANQTLNEFREQRQERWDDAEGFVRRLYTEMTESETFMQYMENGDFSYEADRELIRKLYKTFVVPNEELDDIIEGHSLYWNDDREVIDSFVLKTIKRFDEKNMEEQVLLPMYDKEEDHQFAIGLFRETLHRGPELRQLIRENAKNWDFNRIALMDLVITQTALAEVLTFDSIPLNITFSEYINIARCYSTPKSYAYVNGMLDGIVKRLRSEGRTTKERIITKKAHKPNPKREAAAQKADEAQAAEAQAD